MLKWYRVEGSAIEEYWAHMGRAKDIAHIQVLDSGVHAMAFLRWKDAIVIKESNVEAAKVAVEKHVVKWLGDLGLHPSN